MSGAPHLTATKDVLDDLRGAVERLGGVRSAAKHFKCSPGHLSRVLRGEKELHNSLANYVGYASPATSRQNRATRAVAEGEAESHRPRRVSSGCADDSEGHQCAWKEAIIDAAIVDWIYRKEYEHDPRRAVNDLLCWQAKCALDPAISKEANDLVTRAEQAEAETARLLADLTALAETWDKSAEELRASAALYDDEEPKLARCYRDSADCTEWRTRELRELLEVRASRRVSEAAGGEK